MTVCRITFVRWGHPRLLLFTLVVRFALPYIQRCTICKLVPPPHLVLFVFGFEEDRNRIRSGVVGQNLIKYVLYCAFVAYARCALQASCFVGGPEVLLYYRSLTLHAFCLSAGCQYVLNSALSRSKWYHHHVCFQQRAPRHLVFLFSETEVCQLRGQSWVPSGCPPTRDQNTQTCVCALFISLNNDASFLGHHHGRSPFTDSLVIISITVFPIFEKRGAGNEGVEEKGPFRWLTPLGTTRSCLHGIHLTPTASSRVAAFDLDGTVIKSQYIQVGTRKGSKGGSSGGKRVMKKQANGLGWEWWRAVVPHKLKEVHDSGCAHSRPLLSRYMFLLIFAPFLHLSPYHHHHHHRIAFLYRGDYILNIDPSGSRLY